MSFSAERKAIEVYFTEAWKNSIHSAVPIAYENVAFPPNGDKPWIALYVIPGEGNQMSIGTTPLQRWTGIITIQVFVRAGTGTQAAREIADTVAGILNLVEFSTDESGTLRTRTPQLRTVGVNDGWYQLNVVIPYQRDKFKI